MRCRCLSGLRPLLPRLILQSLLVIAKRQIGVGCEGAAGKVRNKNMGEEKQTHALRVGMQTVSGAWQQAQSQMCREGSIGKCIIRTADMTGSSTLHNVERHRGVRVLEPPTSSGPRSSVVWPPAPKDFAVRAGCKRQGTEQVRQYEGLSI